MTPQQEKAARALGQGYSKKDAAALAGCAQRTINHWLQTDPSFREAAQQEQVVYGDPGARAKLHHLMNTSMKEEIVLRAALGLLARPDENPPQSSQPGRVTVYAPPAPPAEEVDPGA